MKPFLPPVVIKAIPKVESIGLMLVPPSLTFVHLRSGLRVKQFERVGGKGQLIAMSADPSGWQALNLLTKEPTQHYIRLTNGERIPFTLE